MDNFTLYGNSQSVHYVVALVVNIVVSHAYLAHISIAATNILFSVRTFLRCSAC